jgi:hypothetical protein
VDEDGKAHWKYAFNLLDISEITVRSKGDGLGTGTGSSHAPQESLGAVMQMILRRGQAFAQFLLRNFKET